jgi:integrase/recombinase XerD
MLTSWELSLRAERKSPATIRTYGAGVRRFIKWCEQHDRAQLLDRHTVAAFTAGLFDEGLDAATVKARQGAVRRFSKWLAEEGEIERDELIGVKPPKLDSKVIEPLSDVEIKAMLAACSGQDPLRDRRDEAMLRLMVESGVRAGEMIAMGVTDLDLIRGTAIIRRGKGGRGRSVPIGPQTVRAIDRYLRTRRSHRLAGTDQLWLGGQAKSYSYDAMHKSLAMRAKIAGIDGFHPHRLRHTAAHRWLAAGGSEGGLQAVAGWSSPAMLQRDTQARAPDRAADEARKLNLGDF